MTGDPLEAVFHELIDLGRREREARLTDVAREDPELHARLARLLDASEAAERFLAPVERAGPEMPSKLGKYAIIRQIGRGAFGVVYLAHDPDLCRRVAIKILSSAAFAATRAKRLREEARALASMSHPNVAQVYSVEQAESDGQDGLTLLTMEFVPGKPLSIDNFNSMTVHSICDENGLKRLGIAPVALESVVPRYLSQRSARDRLTLFRESAGRT